MAVTQSEFETRISWNSVNISEAMSKEEKEAIYQFRYQVLVDEMGRNIPNADYINKQILDEFDDWGYLIYAESAGQIIGVVRLNIGVADSFPRNIAEIFQFEKFHKFKDSGNLCLGTKLMVAPRYRKTPVLLQLMSRCYEKAREADVQFSFGGCNPYLIPMYEQVGYRQFTPGFQDAGYGFVVPSIILLEDIEHLRAVKSPLLRIAYKMNNSLAARQWFLANFPTDKYQVGLLTSEEERWQYISQCNSNPLSAWPVLRGLSKDEAKKLLHIAVPFECRHGQQFLRRGDVCNELNILIRGEMKVKDETGRTFLARPGNAVGAMGLSAQQHHPVDAVALTDCELLAVSRTPFEKLQRSVPGLAEKLCFQHSDKEVEYDEAQYRIVAG